MSDLSISSNKTAGELLKQKRLSLGLDFKSIEKELKIKEKYLGMLETDRFQGFESSVQAKGFLKNYARFLGLNHEMVVALYRRDFENKDMKRKIEFKEENEQEEEKIIHEENKILQQLNRVVITKRKLQFAAITGILAFILLIGINSIRRSFSKPNLAINSPFEITAPFEGRLAYEDDEIILKGQVDKGSSINVNSVPLNLNADYEFETSPIALQNEETSIVIETENTLGSKNKITLKLFKPEQEIQNLDTIILSNANIGYAIIKADGQVVYEGSIANGTEPLNFIAQRSIEIETQQYENLQISINGNDFILNTPVTIFESNGKDIVKI
ncbi:helix-turn-helix domain-containing protein [Candidatus Dojkabacteria bacterium]|uniref:Helix-turn-helix domain-containing protein n=1 Tax=Candidatus Dojkabacteria bacterium TaxID=2099670 RepID=A0A955IA31_9BACT|nr:helix-turn-helix domain-containing protein [Candidatus Dojkabacteria bacterium]